MVDVPQLRTLIHVAEVGSLGKAAKRLNIAQPALSRQIKMLESELGTQLFERDGRGMAITATGKEVLDHATRVMAELDAIRALTAEGADGSAGLALIGTTPSIAETIVVPLIERLCESDPRLSVRLSSAFSGHLLDWLQRGELDLVISYDPPPIRTLKISPIMTENLMLIRGPDSAELDEMPFRQLTGEMLILPTSRHSTRRIVEECAWRCGIKLKTRFEVDSLGAAVSLVRRGLGATILPLAPIHDLVTAGALRAIPLVDPVPTRKIVLAYSSDRPISYQARRIGEHVVNVAKDLVERQVWPGQMLAAEAFDDDLG